MQARLSATSISISSPAAPCRGRRVEKSRDNMSDLKTRLREDLNSARKERDKQRTQLLTMTLAELRNKEIELGREAEDADVLDVVTKAVKRRKEAAEQIRAAGRTEMADNEEKEAAILGVYLPQQLTEEEVRAIAKEAV